jgi:hypothetical protein
MPIFIGNMKKRILLFMTFFTFQFLFAQYKSTSVLSSFQWYKIGIIQDGVYKIDKAFLNKVNVDLTNINPNNIKIYGNGGKVLPQANNIPRIDDLAEIPVMSKGFDDGSFDASDYLIFFATGPHLRTLNNGEYFIDKNIYSDTSFYFIGLTDSPAKALSIIPSVGLTQPIITESDEISVYENDINSLIKSGRKWFGEAFDGSLTQSFSVSTPDIVPNTTFKATISVAAKSKNPSYTQFNININGQKLGNLVLSCGCDASANTGVQTSQTFNVANLAASSFNFSLTYDKSNDGGAIGYLDYIQLNYKRKLKLSGNQLIFRNIDSRTQDISTYSIENTSDKSLVWDVSNIHDVTQINFSSNGVFSVVNSTVPSEFVVLNPDEVNNKPNSIKKINNQNIHGQTVPELIIVYHPAFYNEAKELSDHKKSIGTSNLLISVEEIYNEFSSGAQDITAIRDMCRMFWKKGGLKNVLLFGSCSYDYKNRIPSNTNFVPTYESFDSFHAINSHCSDDYFGTLKDTEGAFLETGNTYYQMMIGVGRIPVKNRTEASNAVEKIIHYQSGNKTMGKWRNKIAYLSDNGDGNSHFADAERLANRVDTINKQLNINKIHLDAFPLISTPAGSTSPTAKDAIRNAVNQGTVIINYSGHGGPEQLAQEKIIQTSDISQWQNFDKLPFFVTATCDFGVYDEPGKESGGIMLITTEKSGGIGVITAGRPVYQHTNYLLNNAFYSSIFEKDSLGNYYTIGEIMKNTKNRSINGVNNRSYALLGDPSIVLNFPKYTAVVTSINGKSLGIFTDTLKALSVVTMQGEIREGASNTPLSSFNGIVTSDIFDKKQKITTLGQGSDTTSFFIRNSTVQSGQASVVNGKFSFSFVVPKDINYKIGTGKISLYAYEKGTKMDAGGYDMSIPIGGTNPNALIDTIPPKISLFMDDTTFISGGYATSSPTLIARLFDENGINIARSGIGHEITGRISGDENKDLVLNDFYISDVDTYQKGSVVYDLGQMPEGKHSITVKAWDTYNNSSQSTIDFIVASNSKLAIQKMFNYPNPFNDFTTFQIQHNRAGDELEINLTISDLSGKIVKQIIQDMPNSNATLELFWDTISQGNILPGMYVYSCILRSKADGSSDKAFQKLVLIH